MYQYFVLMTKRPLSLQNTFCCMLLFIKMFYNPFPGHSVLCYSIFSFAVCNCIILMWHLSVLLHVEHIVIVKLNKHRYNFTIYLWNSNHNKAFIIKFLLAVCLWKHGKHGNMENMENFLIRVTSSFSAIRLLILSP